MSLISRGLGIAVLGAAVMTSTATPSFAERRVAVRVAPRVAVRTRVFARPAYVVSPRVIVRSYAPYSWYGYYSPYYSPYWDYPSYAVRSNLGEVKINTHLKDASVYVDGGYVGPIAKFKKFSLNPGNHDIELRDGSGRQIFNQRVQVIVDKAIEIRPPS